MALNSTHFFDVYPISPKSSWVAHPDAGTLGEQVYVNVVQYLFLNFTHEVVSSPDPTLEEEKGLVNLGRIFGPALRNFHAPMRS